MSEPLTPGALAIVLKQLPGWSGEQSGLTRTYRFDDFRAAMAFMQVVTPAIDAGNHHPEWTNIYDRVSVRLRTHDAGDRVTDLDVVLAHLLEQAAATAGGR